MACGIFVEACRIFLIVVHGLFLAARRLLSSCGTQAPGRVGSVDVARGLCSLQHVGSLVEAWELSSCGVWA